MPIKSQESAYFFILGRNPALSLAELTAVLQRENLRFRLVGHSREAAVLDIDGEVKELFHELGGTIKFGKVIGEYKKGTNLLSFLLPRSGEQRPDGKHLRIMPPANLLPRSDERGIKKCNSDAAPFSALGGLPAIRCSPGRGKKINFGFSFYKLGEIRDQFLSRLQRKLYSRAMEIKKELRATGQSSRYVVSRERALSSVIVKTNNLLREDGAEIVFLVGSGKTFLGRTIAVQEFKEYEYRDYDRPRPDILRGMLPPKIAKIMINLARVPKEAVLLDPFCGVGTVLSEAAILGYKNLIGVDVDPEAIRDSKINLNWIVKSYDVQPKINLRIADVRGLLPPALQSHSPDRGTVDAVVTEPFLGPLLRGGEKEDIILKIKNELEELYRKAFQNFEKNLKTGGRVVFIFPVWRREKNNVFINLEKIIPENFKIQNLLPPNLQFPEVSPRGGIIWQRPDQKVLREIIVLQKS